MKKITMPYRQFRQELPDALTALLSPGAAVCQIRFDGKPALFQKPYPACDLYLLSPKTLTSLMERYHFLNTLKESYRAISFAPEVFYEAGLPSPFPEGLSALADQVEDLLQETASPGNLPYTVEEPVSCKQPPADFPSLVQSFQALYPFGEHPQESDALFLWVEAHAPELTSQDLAIRWLRAFTGFGSALLTGTDTCRISRTFANLRDLYQKTLS